MSANRLELNVDKTELLWVGPRHSLSQQDCFPPVLQLGPDSKVDRVYGRLLGVTLSTDRSFVRHVSIVSASSFYCMALRLIPAFSARRSLDTAAATLVHSFVASRVDYCNALPAGAPKVTINKLQQLLNAAARVVSGTHKFDRGLSRLLHTDLHWLDVSERESCISSASWRSTACTVKRLRTSWNCAISTPVGLWQMSRRYNISNPPLDSS